MKKRAKIVVVVTKMITGFRVNLSIELQTMSSFLKTVSSFFKQFRKIPAVYTFAGRHFKSKDRI